jgi:hypothetical protein
MRSIAKAVITVLATISVVSAGITQKKIHDLAQTEVYAQALDYVEPLRWLLQNPSRQNHS